MNNSAAQLELTTLKSLKPFDSLDERQITQITRSAVIHRLQPGEILTISTIDSQTEKYIDYLIVGDVELHRNRQRTLLSTNSPQARKPFNEIVPHFTSILAHTSSAILRVEKQSFESVLQLHWQQVFECEELHIESDMHSMSQLLQNRCLLSLPPDNIETVMALMETVSFSAGDYVIRQGEQDNSYYTLLNGRCKVTRRPHDLAQEILLAELNAGASFGEEALITETPRNANIQMITDGTLMRLEKKYFIDYVVNALIEKHDYASLIKKLRQGAKLIDVRGSDEYKRNGHGLHIPLPMLRLRLEKLSKGREYIFCCDNGKRASTAAFLAKQQGFSTSILEGGLNKVPKEYLQRTR